MKQTYLILSFLFSIIIYAQNFDSYFTGNATDVSTDAQFGVCLMGGASENDEAMKWFLNLADGGDVVVLRTSGTDGYNEYMFSELGVSINSVETLVINNQQGAVDTYVLQKISQAEAIWFAGGDQAEYVDFFKDNAVEDLLNNHINVKQYPIGGISAGMAIMGEFYFDALNGTVTTDEALNNPFDIGVSLGVSNFLDNPVLLNTITDTHYDNPERKGRHIAFLARLQASTVDRVFGIGLDEFTAACIDSNGIAKIFGDFPSFEDYAYFIQVNCLPNTTPENLNSNQPLDWNLDQQAVKAYVVPGTSNGSNQFNINTWETGTGGEWQNWWIDQGSFQSQSSTPIDCETFSTEEQTFVEIEYYPNPVTNFLQVKTNHTLTSVKVLNITGKSLKCYTLQNWKNQVDFSDLPKGIYLVQFNFINNMSEIVKITKN